MEMAVSDRLPILTCFPGAPNWNTDNITCIDPRAGLYYYGAVDKIYVLELSNLGYVTSWVGHQDRVTSLSLLSGKDEEVSWLVSGGEDMRVCLWRPDLDNRLKYDLMQPQLYHQVHKKKITYVLGSSDGTRVISGDAGGNLVVWQVESDTFESTQLGQSRIVCMDTIQHQASELLAVGLDNSTILVVSLSEPFNIQYRVTYTGTKPQSLSWVLFDSAPILAASFNDHSIRVWMDYQDTTLKPKRFTVPSFKKPLSNQGSIWVSINWCHELNQEPCLVFGSNAGRLHSWGLGKDSRVLEFATTCRNTGHNRPVYSILPYTTQSGSRIITHSQDRRIIIWNFAQQTIQASISTLGGPARSIDFPNFQPNLAAVGVADSAIRLWSYQPDGFEPSYCSKTLWKTEASSVTRVVFHPELEGVLGFGTGSGLIATYESIYDIIPIQVNISEPVKLKNRHKGTVIGLQWVKWDRILSSAAGPATSHEIEQNDLNQLLGLLGPAKQPLDSEPYALVSLDITGGIRCNFYKSFAPQALSPLFNQPKAAEKIQQFAFALHHPWVAVGYSDNLKVFSMPDHTLIYHSTGKLGAAVSLAWSLDESTLAVGHAGSIIILHATSQFINPGDSIAVYPYPESKLTGHSRDVSSIQWSPHHRHHLVSCSLDGSTIVWDVTAANKVATFYTHPGTPALCCRFCPLDSNAIVTCADDGSVWIWDIQSHPPTTRKQPTKRKEILSNRETGGDASKKLKHLLISDTKPVQPVATKSLQDLLALSSAEPASHLLDTVIETNREPFFSKLWSGDVVDSIDELAGASDMKEDVIKGLLQLALSPLAGPDIYSHMLLKTSQQFQTMGYDARISASLLVAAGQLHQALDLLVSHHHHRDAITLCKLRFPPGHRQLKEVYLKYAAYLSRSELYEESCKYYLLGQQPTLAITTISLRNNRDSLLVALNLAHQYQDPTLDIRIWRFLSCCLSDHQYQLASTTLDKFELSVTVGAYLMLLSTHQWRSALPQAPSIKILDPETKSTPTVSSAVGPKVTPPNPDAIELENLDEINLDLNNSDEINLDIEDSPSAPKPDLESHPATDIRSGMNNPNDPLTKHTLIPADLHNHWQTFGITVNSAPELMTTIQRPHQPSYEVTLRVLVDHLQLRPGDLAPEGRRTLGFLQSLLE